MDREKVIKGLETCIPMKYETNEEKECRHEKCPYGRENYKPMNGCLWDLMTDALALLKEQGVRELTMDEWREWKTNKKRDPICKLWEYDTSPMWVFSPNDVHEPAFLMGKLKLFTGKPTFEQCKAVKWEWKS